MGSQPRGTASMCMVSCNAEGVGGQVKGEVKGEVIRRGKRAAASFY